MDDNSDLFICGIDAISEGEALGVDPFDNGQDLFFIVRFGGELHAWRNSCPHVPGSPMAWRRNAYMNAAGTMVTCHSHGALFEPNTGLCVQGPCEGHQLSRVPLVVDGDRVSLPGTALRRHRSLGRES